MTTRSEPLWVCLMMLGLLLLSGCPSPNRRPPPTVPPPKKMLAVQSPPRPQPLVAAAAVAVPTTVTLAWSPPVGGTVISGYRLYQGIKSHTYTNTFTLGLATNATVPIITGQTNYFAVKSLSTSGGTTGESVFSNEAVYSAQKKTLSATIISYVETSTNNQFSGWTVLASYTNYFPVLPDPSFFQTRLSITVSNSP